MFESSIKDSELLTMKHIGQAVKIKPDTIHSMHRRYGFLPSGIVVSLHAKDPKNPFKTKVGGREIYYSGRMIEYFIKIKKLKEEGLSYDEIAKRKDVQDEKKLIQLLHEINLTKDPLNKNEDDFKNFDLVIDIFGKRVGEESYARLSKDAATALKDYKSVNSEIEKRAYAGNFKVDDLLKKKQHVATRLALFYEMMRTVFKKIGEIADKDPSFKEEVIKAMKKVG